MVKREISIASDSEEEVLATYVPPGERTPFAKGPPRKKRAAAARTAGNGVGVGVGVGVGGSAAAGEDAASVKKKQRSAAAQARLQLTKNSAKIIYGIDFGTTFSGIAYSVSDKIDQITTLMDLDDSNQDNPKVPSCIQFKDGGIIWGSDSKDDPESVEWYKLLLVDENDLPDDVRGSEHVLTARNRLRELGKTPEDVIGAYLKGLWSSCLAKVKIEVGEATVNLSRFHVVMTLPAIWPDYARLRMKEAVEDAGILIQRPGVADTVLTFVSEPEAAALATLKRVDGRCDIEDDDCFVVCDAGGGTVDLVSYKVTRTEPMVVREVVKGTGSLCGAVFVDDQFTVLLKQKFGEISPDAWDTLTTAEIQKIMSEDWIKIRNRFMGDAAQEFTIRAPSSLYTAKILDVNEAWKLIKITASDMEKVFEPTLKKIENLVTEQALSVATKEGRPPKYVILVGGFGRNKYMHMYLKEHIGSVIDVEVLQSQGAEPWTAICRGAVIHGLTVEKVPSHFSVEVASRISRASYGVMCMEKWDKQKHNLQDKIFDEQEQISKANNQMKWLIREGEDVMTNKKTLYDFKRFFDINDHPEHIYTSLWACFEKTPPKRKDHTVFKHSSMKWTAKIHWDKLPRVVNKKDQEFHELEFQAEMVCSGGATETSVLHKGRRVVKNNLEVVYHDKANIGA